MPGMTATLIIQTAEQPNSTSIPNSAISFALNKEELTALKQEKYKVIALNNPEKSTVWVRNNKTIEEKEVTVKFTNGIQSAITGSLTPGDSIITNIKVTVGIQKTGSLFARPEED
jgi:multidrug efflux pump subunit AcrA (membrane-fusion protein)